MRKTIYKRILFLEKLFNKIENKSKKNKRRKTATALAVLSNVFRLLGFVSFAKKASGKTKIIFPK